MDKLPGVSIVIPNYNYAHFVGKAIESALAPAALDALSRARRTQMQMDSALRTSAERQLERKRYPAALAERQFNKVDPDNRLVAAELERRWEAALNEVRAAEEALAQQTSPQTIAHMGMGKALHGKIVASPAVSHKSGLTRPPRMLNARRCCDASSKRSCSIAVSTTSPRSGSSGAAAR